MFYNFIRIGVCLLTLAGWQQVVGQVADTVTPSKELLVDVELRMRTELRNGYRQLRLDTTTAAFYTGQRTRLSVAYKHPKYRLQLSGQDVRVWGDTDPRSTKGSIQLFEGYGDWLFGKGWFVRAGRQRVMYDNQRLFAQNDWRHNANVHDGVTVHYGRVGLDTELGAFFNQTGEQVFTTNFSPTGYSNYKLLVVHHLKAKLGKGAVLTTIQAADGFQDAADASQMHLRYTQGGRMEWERGEWYATLSGYYQYGYMIGGEPIGAFYCQPEVKFAAPNGKLWVRLGAEWMSGEDAQDVGDEVYRSFVALYGVAHRFNGYMDFFTSFPSDLGNAGLINPYSFVQYQFSRKGFVRADCHLFYSHYPFVQPNGQVMGTYLGFENDWVVNYALNEVTKLELGVSWASAADALAAVKRAGDASLTPYWGYLMLTFKPEIFRHTSK